MISRKQSDYILKMAKSYPVVTNVARSLVVYSGETHADVAVNFADVSGWCR